MNALSALGQGVVTVILCLQSPLIQLCLFEE